MYMLEKPKTARESKMKPKASSCPNSIMQSYKTDRSSMSLPSSLQSGIESLSGFHMGNVHVHYNSLKPLQLQALAYTQGTEIHVAPGQERYLPHEAWHVVQQMQGRVKPTGRIGGEAINDNAALEREADIMGEKAARAEGMEERPLQLKECPSGVAQLSHIVIGDQPDYAQIKLWQNTYPTIIFESMDQNFENARAIFDETKKYPGNTVCVFGLNRRLPEDISRDDKTESPPKQNNKNESVNKRKKKPSSEPINESAPLALGTIADTSSHFFRGFTFEWTKPSKVEKTEQYKMPFIEARAEVMKQAEKVKEKIEWAKCTEDGKYIPPNQEFSENILYRWIDGDARDDTSRDIPKSSLLRLASGEYSVLSGSYYWRPTVSGNYTFLNQFIDKVNECEQKVRAKYFEVKGQRRPNGDSRSPSLARLDSFLSGTENLTGFYLPETTLMMNEDAHHAILKAIRSKQAASEILALRNDRTALMKYDRTDLDTDLSDLLVTDNSAASSKKREHALVKYSKDKDEFEMGKSQEKESMRMLTYANISKQSVYFEQKLRASKPLKRQFEENTPSDNPNYLGSEMLALLKEGSNITLEEFMPKLLSMRQSVFDQFHIPDDQAGKNFNAYKKALIKELFDCYQLLRLRIKDELSPPET